MANKNLKISSIPFVVLTKQGIYTLDTIYMEKFFSSMYLSGSGPSARDITIVEGDYETLCKMLDKVHSELQESISKNKKCVVDLRSLDKTENKKQ